MRLSCWRSGFRLRSAQKRVALVIGNDSYQNVTPLKKAGNDAERVAKTLKGLGFQVISATNQSRRGMSDSLSAFERTLGEGDTAFFFFAGHGFQIKGENYLLPTDVPMALAGEEEKIHENSFLARRILERMRGKGARTTIVVLDACRNNPFERAGTRAVRERRRARADERRRRFRDLFGLGKPDRARLHLRRRQGPELGLHPLFRQGAGDAGAVAGAGRQAHAGERHRRWRARSSTRRRPPITTRSSATWC